MTTKQSRASKERFHSSGLGKAVMNGASKDDQPFYRIRISLENRPRNLQKMPASVQVTIEGMTVRANRWSSLQEVQFDFFEGKEAEASGRPTPRVDRSFLRGPTGSGWPEYFGLRCWYIPDRCGEAWSVLFLDKSSASLSIFSAFTQVIFSTSLG